MNYKELRKLETSEYPMIGNKLDQDWIAHRLAFLWDLRDEKTEYYLGSKMCEEKEEIYSFVDYSVIKRADEIWQSGE